jgi:hypothetical protein
MTLAIRNDSVLTEDDRRHTAAWLLANIEKAPAASSGEGEPVRVIEVICHWQDGFAIEYSPSKERFRIVKNGGQFYPWSTLDRVLDRAAQACFRDNSTDD